MRAEPRGPCAACWIRAGTVLTRREPIDLAAVAFAALRTHDLSAFSSTVDLEEAWTTGHPDLLALLAANLVSNAIQHNVVGGKIEMATRAESGRAVLSVANSGPRIPPGELQRLFQPFQRLASDSPDTAGGVGLGLPIVQMIAEAHAAKVTARAQTDGGLEIDVWLPAACRSGRPGPPARR